MNASQSFPAKDPDDRPRHAGPGAAGVTLLPADHLALVAEMARDFAGSRDIDATLGLGLRRIAAMLEAEGASLFLIDEATGELVARACYGPVDITGLRLPEDVGIVGRAVASGQSQIVSDAHEDPDFAAHVEAEAGVIVSSVLCAPLQVRKQCLGAIELVNKRDGEPFAARDVSLLEALAASAALALINARMTEAIVEQEGLRRQIELAAEIQRGFLPPAREADFPVHGINLPARRISGDFYDAVALPDGRVWFCVADVAGKGVKAALLMAKTASLFRYLAKSARDPWTILHAINGELVETAAHGLFVTMTCGVYQPDIGSLRLANAGHEPGLLVDGAAATAVELPAQTPPLGIVERLTAIGGTHPQTVDIDLRGQRLYLFTDGLTEARDSAGMPLGQEGLIELIHAVEAALPDPARRVAEIVRRVAPQDGAPNDDVTLLTVVGPGKSEGPP